MFGTVIKMSLGLALSYMASGFEFFLHFTSSTLLIPTLRRRQMIAQVVGIPDIHVKNSNWILDSRLQPAQPSLLQAFGA